MNADYADLARLAEAARTATRGLPWVKDPDSPDKVLASKDGGWDGSLVATVASDDFDLVEEEVTEFIAAANHATILRLIEDLRQERLRAGLLRVEVEELTRERGEIADERDQHAARLAALADLIARSEARTDATTGLLYTADLRAALSAAPTDGAS